MNIYLEHVFQPLLKRLSTDKLLNFTSCNKFLNNVSEEYLKTKCQQLYDIENYKISWRYTLSLLKHGYKDIPIFINLCDNNIVKLEYKCNITIYADIINDDIIRPELLNSLNDIINGEFYGYSYYTCSIQILKNKRELEDSIRNYLNTFDIESEHNVRWNWDFLGESLLFCHDISTPRKNCERINNYDDFNDNKYIGISNRNSDNKSLFEVITSIDIFVVNEY